MVRKFSNPISLATLMVLWGIIIFFRIDLLMVNELSWDVFGYYLYLVATFVHHDPMLKDISWIELANAKYSISSTIYQISAGPENNAVYFFLMGMSILYAPWFFLAHVLAGPLGYAQDGFSAPYQVIIPMGFLLYTLIGLIFFRKVLLKFFSDTLSSILMIILVVGTNFIQFATAKNLETINSLFILNSMLVWFTIRWHEDFKRSHLIIIALLIAETTLIKPSEVFCVLIPLFWGVYNRESLLTKINLIKTHVRQIIPAVVVGFALFIPQMIYWKMAVGHFVYDSYKNPGVGLDFTSPHIINILFSYRKGWLLYTPVMVFALWGFYFLYKQKKELFPVVLGYFLVSFYIIASWTEWWYGASFSVRPMIITYVLLSLPLGYLLLWIKQQRMVIKSLLILLISFSMFMNLFYWWQYQHYILDHYRTTKEYFWAVFLKTNIDPSVRDLLMKEHSATGVDVFPGEQGLQKKEVLNLDFSAQTEDYKACYEQDSTGNAVFRLDSNAQFSPGFKTPFRELSEKEWAWFIAEVDVKIPAGYQGELPCLTVTTERKEGVYAYRTACLNPDSVKYGQWQHLRLEYLTPEFRSRRDNIQSYIWHRGKMPIYIDNYRLVMYE